MISPWIEVLGAAVGEVAPITIKPNQARLGRLSRTWIWSPTWIARLWLGELRPLGKALRVESMLGPNQNDRGS